MQWTQALLLVQSSFSIILGVPMDLPSERMMRGHWRWEKAEKQLVWRVRHLLVHEEGMCCGLR